MPCKTVVIPGHLRFLNPIYYRHMIGRAGRRGFDTIGNIVYFGVPKNKIKNFIASNTSKIKGSFSLNLKLISQFSLMQFNDQEVWKVFESYIRNPIARLSTKHELRNAQKSIFIKIQYLISNNYIDSNFYPQINKIKSLILLRNENFESIALIDFITSQSFDQLTLNKTKNEICDLLCIIISHFFDTKIFLEEQTNAVSNIILQEIPELRSYLFYKENEIIQFIQRYLDDEDDTEYFLKGFSNMFKNILMPKNSYIYDFYLNGNLETIKKVNNVSLNRLWYAMKELRFVVKAIECLFNSKSTLVKDSFEFFSKKADERFFEITN